MRCEMVVILATLQMETRERDCNFRIMMAYMHDEHVDGTDPYERKIV